MPFIPHTEEDRAAMLAAVGADHVDALFDEVPPALRTGARQALPPGMGEQELMRLARARAGQDSGYLNFIGAGAYEHHIPEAVWEIASRGEFYTAYTPYQAEASQGTLQLLYEYQSMMAALTALDVSNASLYDGASALAEAVLMAVRAHRKSRRIVMPATVHPVWRRVVETIVRHQGIECVELAHCIETGALVPEALGSFAVDSCAALVLPQPNFFGVLEDVDALTDAAHAKGMFVIGAVNPIAAALLSPPGEWGAKGADIAIGEGQPLGAPLSSGGPYLGFLCAREALVRQMPGRIIGRTVDLDGREGFTLTLQAREQHIRRAKATSNICTNQGLIATVATIHMALLGPEGLRRVAAECHARTTQLVARLERIPGVSRLFTGPVFHEAALGISEPVGDVLRALEAQGILGGFDLSEHYGHLGHALLVCATETKTDADIERFAHELERILTKRRLDPPCAVKSAVKANPTA